MKDFKSAFVDTAVFIYLLEDHPDFGEKAEFFFQYASSKKAQLFTTVLSYLEFCIKPYQENRESLAAIFLDFLHEANFTTGIIDLSICDEAARLRAKYPALKSVDALQLASAIKSACEVFMTNDRRLRQVNEIEVLLVEDWGR